MDTLRRYCRAFVDLLKCSYSTEKLLLMAVNDVWPNIQTYRAVRFLLHAVRFLYLHHLKRNSASKYAPADTVKEPTIKA